MSYSPSGSKVSVLNAAAITKNADDVPGCSNSTRDTRQTMRISDSSSESRMRHSDYKGRRSRSDSKGRKSSLKRSSHRRRNKQRSPMQSSSHHSGDDSIFSEGSFYEDDGDDGDLQARTSHSSHASNRRDKRSDSLKSFFDDDDEDAKPRAKGSSEASPNRTKTSSSISSRHSTAEDSKAKVKTSRGSRRSSKHDYVSPLGESTRSTVSSILYGIDDEDNKAKAKASRGSKRSLKPGMEVVSNLGSSSHHSKRSSGTKKKRNTVEILYGNDADAKSKARQTRSSRSPNPGVERVIIENESERSRSSRNISPPDFTSERSRFSRSASPPAFVGIVIEDNSSPARMPNASVVVDRSDRSVASSKKRKSQQRKQASYTKWIVLAFVIALIGGGVTAFIALRKDDDDQRTQDAGIQDSAGAPKAPAGSPSNRIPTAPPSEQQMRDPPNAEDCAAIRNNQTTVPGNNSTSNWNVNVQINVKGETGVTDEMLQQLLDSIQDLLLPSMAGCNDAEQRKLVDIMARPSVIRGASRALDVFIDDSRFAIHFAYVKGEIQEDAACVNTTTPEICHIVLLEFTLYLDSDISSGEVEKIITMELEAGNDIVSKLDLDTSFLSANARDITNVSPMDAPSISPSKSPTKSPTVPSATDNPDSPTAIPNPEPTDAPDSPTPSTSDPSESPSAMPTGVPSTLESMLPSTTPSALPSPPPTVVPTVLSSRAPSTKPSAAPSISPTDLPSTVPTEAPSVLGSSSPSLPGPSGAPSEAPTSRSPSFYPSPSPSPSPSRSAVTTTFPSLSPTKGSMAPTQCFCLQAAQSGASCDAITVARADISCGSCSGQDSCVGFRKDDNDPLYVGMIRSNACLGGTACGHAIVDWIGNDACVGFKSCKGRYIDASSNSCTGSFACAASTNNLDGKLIVLRNSCLGNFSCYSREITADYDSCIGDFACAGRLRMYVAPLACIAPNACGGVVFTQNSIVQDQAQQQTSYIGEGSCTCENCCVCMIRVVSFRCTTPGECCDADDPTLKAAGVHDNTEEEMRQDLGATNLEDVFLGGCRRKLEGS